MATGSLFSGIGSFGSNFFSPWDFMGGFGSSLPWIPPVWAEEEAAQAEPVPEVVADSAETPPDTGPGFGQTQTSWDPLGVEGYEATQGGLSPSLPTTYEGLGDLFSSFPTTTEEWGDLYSSFPSTWAEAGERITALATPINLAKGVFSLVAGLPATAFFTVAEAMAESRRNERYRSQFPELGEAQTGFFGGTPGFSERDYATLAAHGRTVDIGAGAAALSVTPEGFQARPSPVRQRYDETQWGYAPGDRAWDNYMAAHAELLEPGDPRHTLTQAALDRFGLPPGSTQWDLFQPWDTIDRWGTPIVSNKTIDQGMWEDAWNAPPRDWVFDPMVYTEYLSGPDLWGEKTVSTADFNYNYQDPYAGLPGYELGVQEEWDAAHIKNVELIAQYHADREKVEEEVAQDIRGLTPGPWSAYADFPTAAETAQMKWDATQRALAEAGYQLRTDRPEVPEPHAFLQDPPAQKAFAVNAAAIAAAQAADVNAAAVAAAQAAVQAAADLEAQMEDEEAAGGGGPDPGDFGGDPEGGYGAEDPGVW